MRTRKKSMGPFTRARNAVIEELAAKLNIDARGCKERIVAESETYPESLHRSANMGGFETPCHDLYDLPEFRWMVPGALERIQCLDYLCVIHRHAGCRRSGRVDEEIPGAGSGRCACASGCNRSSRESGIGLRPRPQRYRPGLSRGFTESTPFRKRSNQHRFARTASEHAAIRQGQLGEAVHAYLCAGARE